MRRLIALCLVSMIAACSPVEPEKAEQTPASAPAVVDTTTIPAVFLGRWDASLDACATNHSDMRLSVEPTRVAFYESGGEVHKVTAFSPTEIAVDVIMTGEGETWNRTLRMALSEGGKALTLDASKTGVRVRCP